MLHRRMVCGTIVFLSIMATMILGLVFWVYCLLYDVPMPLQWVWNICHMGPWDFLGGLECQSNKHFVSKRIGIDCWYVMSVHCLFIFGIIGNLYKPVRGTTSHQSLQTRVQEKGARHPQPKPHQNDETNTARGLKQGPVREDTNPQEMDNHNPNNKY